MKNIALVVGAALALSVMAAPVALAQNDTESCDEAKRTVSRLEVRLAGVITEERNAEKAALDTAQEALRLAREELQNAPAGADLPALRAARDAAQNAVDAARAALTSDSKRLADLRVELKTAVEKRDKACDDDTPPTTTTPPPTTVVEDPDVDCTEVSDARAQEILNADKNDPNNLDEDNDGIACEEEVVVKRDVVVAPSGGVNTGGGPA